VAFLGAPGDEAKELPMGRFEWTQLGSERATLARRSPVPDVDGAGYGAPRLSRIRTGPMTAAPEPTRDSALSIATILALPDVVPLHVAAPCKILAAELSRAGAPYRVRVCGEHPGPVPTRSGFGLQVEAGLEALVGAGLVVVAGTFPADPVVGPPVLEALRLAYRRGAALVAIGTGAFILARTGLLDGRRATTHWRHSADLARRYPRISVHPHVLAIEDAGIYTSAALTSAVDVCLEIARRNRGATIANEAARNATVTGHRSAVHPQLVGRLLARATAGAVAGGTAEVRVWMLDHLKEPMNLDELATRAHMSRRQFTRRFRVEAGISPWQWLLAQRLVEAQRLLEATAEPVESIGRCCGFATPLAFRTRFKQVVGVSPSRYRKAAPPRAPVFVPTTV
jgi:AraC family transcriptional regulator, transcriptional activator FtrA